MRLAWGSVFRNVDDASVASAKAELASLPDAARVAKIRENEAFLEAWHQKIGRDVIPMSSDMPAIELALAIAGTSENDQ